MKRVTNPSYFASKSIALDIETIPDENIANNYTLNVEEESKKLQPPKNYKDPDVIKKWTESKIEELNEKKQQQFNDLALSTWTGRMCAYAVVSAEHYMYGYINNADDKNEIVILLKLIDAINNSCQIITYNGIQFDIPFIYGRCCLLGIKTQHLMSYYTQRYKIMPHCDLRMVLGDWDKYAKGKLDFYGSRLLNIGRKNDIDHTEYLQYVKQKRGIRIGTQCLQHTKLTYQLYNRIKPYYISTF